MVFTAELTFGLSEQPDKGKTSSIFSYGGMEERDKRLEQESAKVACQSDSKQPVACKDWGHGKPA